MVVVAALCFASAAGAQQDGKALVEKVCAKCHTLDATMRQRNTKDRWSAIVDDMVARGAEATDAELEQIVEYLARNLGPKVAVNKAGADQLAAGLGIPRDVAAAIVEYRQKNGPFKTLEDLQKVRSLNTSGIDGKKDRLDFSEAK